MGPLERGKTPTDEELIPPRAVLFEQQDRLARGADARPGARRLDLHQRDEAVDLRLVHRDLCQDTAETERLLAELRPHPIVAGGGRVAFVENEIEDPEHRRKPGGAFGLARNLEGNARLGERPLGADNALGDGRLRHQERPGDLLGGQAAEQAQRERNALLGGEHRVAGRE